MVSICYLYQYHPNVFPSERTTEGRAVGEVRTFTPRFLVFLSYLIYQKYPERSLALVYITSVPCILVLSRIPEVP